MGFCFPFAEQVSVKYWEISEDSHVCSSVKCPDFISIKQYALLVPDLGMAWQLQFLSQPKVFLHNIYLHKNNIFS